MRGCQLLGKTLQYCLAFDRRGSARKEYQLSVVLGWSRSLYLYHRNYPDADEIDGRAELLGQEYNVRRQSSECEPLDGGVICFLYQACLEGVGFF